MFKTDIWMREPSKNNYEEGAAFDLFLLDLREQDDTAWIQLLDHFREKVVPYIRKIDGRLPQNAIVSVDYFIEEIFANSLIKFYELFAKGQFENLGQLRGMMFRIAELKLKEAYKQVQKDQTLFFVPPEKTPLSEQLEHSALSKELEQEQVVRQLEKALAALPAEDREVLLRFAKGERLKNIAQDMEINETSCRKKKQRALEKMRKLLQPLIPNQGL